jgi:hypothetical protein
MKEGEMDGESSTHEREGNAYEVLTGKPNGKKPPGRPSCIWEDNIKTILNKYSEGCGFD